jgi:GntR family transcriptional regulator, transcriptional repressor for pyruvate dehydrogenase complex
MATEPMFEQAERALAYRTVSQVIRAAILDGRLKQGDLLPVEQDLAEQLGVTRSTISEGLRVLENAGLVERGRRRRLQVALPSQKAVGSAMHDALVLQRITYRDLWEVLQAIEPMAAELAAQRATPHALNALRNNLRATAEVIDDPGGLSAADVDFHSLVAEITGNHALLLARSMLGSLFYPAYGEVIRRLGPGRRLLAAHTNVVDAIDRGDAALAAEWMSKHIRDFRRGCDIAGIDLNHVVEALVDG